MGLPQCRGSCVFTCVQASSGKRDLPRVSSQMLASHRKNDTGVITLGNGNEDGRRDFRRGAERWQVAVNWRLGRRRCKRLAQPLGKFHSTVSRGKKVPALQTPDVPFPSVTASSASS